MSNNEKKPGDAFLIILITVMLMAFASVKAEAKDKFVPTYEDKPATFSFKLKKEMVQADKKVGNPLYRRSTRRVQVLKEGKEGIRFGVEGGLGADNEPQLLLRFRKDF